jgi:hypothetical protein
MYLRNEKTGVLTFSEACNADSRFRRAWPTSSKNEYARPIACAFLARKARNNVIITFKHARKQNGTSP